MLARVGVAVVTLALLAPPSTAQAPAGLDAFVTAQMARRHIDGLSLAVVQDGRIVYAKGYGVTDRAEGRRVDTTTLFQAGSISKPVFALGALALVEHGKLALDADVNGALHSWQVPASAYTATEKVTLRRLLSHTAGLTVHGFPGYDVDSVRPTVVQVLDGATPANTAPVRNDTAPGARYNYSGGGFTIAQLLVTEATGRPLPAYLHDAVLAPLGMARSSYEQPLPPALAANTAAGHYDDGRAVHGRWHVYPEMAAAGLWTTASDLARFAIGVQRAYAGAAYAGAAGAVVSPATAKTMLTEQMSGYGVGVAVRTAGGVLRFGHSGRDEGFDARLEATTTGLAYAIMINANDDSRLVSRVGDFIEQIYRWPGAPAYHAPNAVAVPPAEVDAATGLYDVGGGGFLTLVSRGGRLYTSVGGAPDEELVPLGSGRFASADRDVTFTLARDGRGRATSLTRAASAGNPRTLPRLGPLLRAAAAAGTLTPTDAARGDSVLRALAAGTLRTVGGVTAGMKNDFATTVWLPVAKLRDATPVGASAVAGGEVTRHGGAVARLGYYRARTDAGPRLIVVYYTADGMVTDVDVVDE